MTSLFSARGVSVGNPGARAVAGVDLDIEPGRLIGLIGLIGPDGAGQSTFFGSVTSSVRPEGGVAPGGSGVAPGGISLSGPDPGPGSCLGGHAPPGSPAR